MSDLAFNANGESFEVPATVTGWRVRRMKPRGAPELVYGRDGRPLVVGVECEMDDLREAVGGVLGRYRLDPVNDDGKCVENVPPAYIHVVKPERNAAEDVVPVAAPSSADDTIREAMRMNTELAKAVIERFPEMLTAGAELLRAADGAGLTRREPRVIVEREDEEHEDDEIEEAPAPVPSATIELVTKLVAQFAPLVINGLMSKKGSLASVLDWRKAVPAEPKELKSAKPARPDGPGDASAGVPENATDVFPPIDANTMAHFMAVQSALTPDERAIATEVAKGLSAPELHAWFEDLTKLSVPDAVARIRSLIAGQAAGGAS